MQGRRSNMIEVTSWEKLDWNITHNTYAFLENLLRTFHFKFPSILNFYHEAIGEGNEIYVQHFYLSAFQIDWRTLK